MKNLITLVAMLVSVSGIVLSLAREEVRCYVGLDSANCPSTSQKQPLAQPQEAARPAAEVRETKAPEPLAETADGEKSSPETETKAPEPLAEPAAENSGPETETKAPEPEAKKSNPKREGQLLEVIPAPEANSSTSVPLEVIPPPEQ